MCVCVCPVSLACLLLYRVLSVSTTRSFSPFPSFSCFTGALLFFSSVVCLPPVLRVTVIGGGGGAQTPTQNKAEGKRHLDRSISNASLRVVSDFLLCLVILEASRSLFLPRSHIGAFVVEVCSGGGGGEMRDERRQHSSCHAPYYLFCGHALSTNDCGCVDVAE